MALPEVTAKLDADVSGFIAAWDKAAQAAERAAARIRAAQASIGDIDIDTDKLRQVGAELNKVAESMRKVGASAKEFGNDTRQSSGGLDELGEKATRAGAALGGSGGGGLAGGFTRSAAGGKLMAAAVVAIAAVLPAVSAAALALGAALQGLTVAGAVVAGGWRGIEQAGERLKASMGGLQKQLESVFRSELSGEFQKLGQAISQMDGPLKAIARSTSDVVKSFTGWIRSAEGARQLESLLGGVDNMMKSLAPGAKALAQSFTAFGEAAAPVLGEVGKALSSVFENINKVIQKAKESGQLEKAFKAGAAAIEAFGEVLAGVIAIFIEMAASGGEPAADAIKKFGKAMQDAAPAIGVAFGQIARLINVIATVVGWFGQLLKALDPVTKKLQEAGDAFDKFVKDGEGFKKLGAVVAAAFELVKKAVEDGVNKAKEDVKKWWEDTKKSVDEGVKKVQESIKKWWDDTKKKIDDGVKKAVESVKKWIDDSVKKVKEGAQDFVDGCKKWWDETGQAIGEGVENAIKWVEELPEKAKDALDQAVKDFVQAGEDMGKGIAEGLEKAVSNVVSQAKELAQKALDAIKETLGIKSPSVVFRNEVGAMIPAGIAEGIIGNAGKVTDAMQRTGLGAVAAGKNSALAAGAALGRSAGGPMQVTLKVGGGADSAMGTAIAKLARTGQLRITANAVRG